MTYCWLLVNWEQIIGQLFLVFWIKCQSYIGHMLLMYLYIGQLSMVYWPTDSSLLVNYPWYMYIGQLSVVYKPTVADVLVNCNRYLCSLLVECWSTIGGTCGKHGGLMVSVLVSWSSGLALSSGWEHCVVFWGKTQLSQCLSPLRCINGYGQT